MFSSCFYTTFNLLARVIALTMRCSKLLLSNYFDNRSCDWQTFYFILSSIFIRFLYICVTIKQVYIDRLQDFSDNCHGNFTYLKNNYKLGSPDYSGKYTEWWWKIKLWASMLSMLKISKSNYTWKAYRLSIVLPILNINWWCFAH